ncbi:C4-dicarboxylate ABC transporter [Paenibacillus rhizovicinus]|uniref:C4-dicarboxylate ABC transporter n=1 Tax=Paenibacillus rhizovicinus TaxID=2704463 RepID=A0A6C0NUK7_9BACL|nr:SLAC1 anion channel family protein [Paenibacillus rhizovicinus]QHW29616.1 C4-dicarboxylate ABC transporter [Paenibacillus rhizovicinus]
MQTMAAVQKQRSIGSIQFLPVNLFAAVMGISGLSLAWRQASKAFGISTAIADSCGMIAVLIFIVLGVGYLTKWFLYPQRVKAEFNHPITGNFFGTIPIAILLLSTVIGMYSERSGQALWVTGTTLALILCVVFVSRLLNGNLEPVHKVPATLVPVVGTLDIPVAGGTMPFPWAHEINLMSLAIGGIVALVYITLIFSRLAHHAPMPPGLTPSLIIMIAPFEVGFLGYTNFEQRIDPFASLLYYFGLFLFIVLFFKVFRKSIPFSASWWGISFPIAALTNAALKYGMYVDSWPLIAVSVLLLALLSIVIVVLFVRTVSMLVNGSLLKG